MKKLPSFLANFAVKRGGKLSEERRYFKCSAQKVTFINAIQIQQSYKFHALFIILIFFILSDFISAKKQPVLKK